MKIRVLLLLVGIALLPCSCSEPTIERVTLQDRVSSMYSDFSDIAELGTVEYTVKQVIRGKSHTKIGRGVLVAWAKKHPLWLDGVCEGWHRFE